MGSCGGGQQWIVLLEAAGGPGQVIDNESFLRLVAACGTPAPTTLFSPDRYALQMSVQAADTPSALSAAVARWQRALERCQLPSWELVRSEVMTPAELEWDLEHADLAAGGAPAEQAGRPVPAGIDPMEEELLRRALFDPVTGLASRELFLEAVRCALDAGPAPSWVRAVMVVRVDLPEGTGPAEHPPADELLAEVAHRLAGAVRDGDTLARVGPHEFAVLLEVRSADDTDLLTERILDSIRCPPLGHQAARPVGAAAGVAMTSCGNDADHLLQMAELAMLAAAGQPPGGGRLPLSDGTGPARTTAGRNRVPRLAGDVHEETP